MYIVLLKLSSVRKKAVEHVGPSSDELFGGVGIDAGVNAG